MTRQEENKNEKNKKDVRRTIFLKLLGYKDETKTIKGIKKLKGTGIYINEVFSEETATKRKEFWEEVKRLREQGKYAAIRLDSHDFKK